MAGMYDTFDKHTSTSMIFDGGGECTGQAWCAVDRERMGNHKENFNGAGGIHHEMFMTHDAPAECYRQHADILQRVSRFFQSDLLADSEAVRQREHPETLVTGESIPTIRRTCALKYGEEVRIET